jgi:hypothetical protein
MHAARWLTEDNSQTVWRWRLNFDNHCFWTWWGASTWTFILAWRRWDQNFIRSLGDESCRMEARLLGKAYEGLWRLCVSAIDFDFL